MIFLDTNIILRFLTPPATGQDEARKRDVRNLFERLSSGEITATTSEVVLHEACFVLGSARHYGYGVDAIAPAMTAIVQFPGLQFPSGDKETYLRALDLWQQHPKLEFSDSVIAARCERAGHELATFDRHFASIPSISIWRPPDSDAS